MNRKPPSPRAPAAARRRRTHDRPAALESGGALQSSPIRSPEDALAGEQGTEAPDIGSDPDVKHGAAAEHRTRRGFGAVETRNLRLAFSASRLRLRYGFDVLGPWRLASLIPLWTVVQRYLVFAGPVDERDLGRDFKGRFEFCELSTQTVDAAQQANPVLDRPTIERRLEAGERCGLWWAGGQVVHYRWLATGPARLPFAPLLVRPSHDEFVVQEVFTLPSYRRQGLMTLSRTWAVQAAARAGRSQRISFIAWWNRPSLAAARPHDRCVGSLTSWRLALRSFHRARGEVWLSVDASEVFLDRFPTE